MPSLTCSQRHSLDQHSVPHRTAALLVRLCVRLLLCFTWCPLVQIKGDGQYLDSHAHATAESYKDYDMLQSGNSMEASFGCL